MAVRVKCSPLYSLFLPLALVLLSGAINFASAISISPNVSSALVDRLAITSTLSYGVEPMGEFQSITIPLKRAGRLFLLEAQVDDQVGNLVFDTGAEGLVLNKTYFRNYNSTPKYSGSGITGDAGDVAQIRADRVSVSSVYYEKVTADVTDLSHIENKRGIKILGLFGLNMIKSFEVVLDAVNGELRLYRINKKGERLSLAVDSTRFDVAQRLELPYSILRVAGKINGKSLYFCLDTGAEINVLNSSLSKAVISTVTISRRSRLGGAGASVTEVLYGSMSEFMFGNHQVGPMPTIVTNLSTMGEAYGCSIDGMLGCDFLEKGIISINFVKKEVKMSFSKGVLR